MPGRAKRRLWRLLFFSRASVSPFDFRLAGIRRAARRVFGDLQFTRSAGRTIEGGASQASLGLSSPPRSWWGFPAGVRVARPSQSDSPLRPAERNGTFAFGLWPRFRYRGFALHGFVSFPGDSDLARSQRVATMSLRRQEVIGRTRPLPGCLHRSRRSFLQGSDRCRHYPERSRGRFWPSSHYRPRGIDSRPHFFKAHENSIGNLPAMQPKCHWGLGFVARLGVRLGSEFLAQEKTAYLTPIAFSRSAWFRASFSGLCETTRLSGEFEPEADIGSPRG